MCEFSTGFIVTGHFGRAQELVALMQQRGVYRLGCSGDLDKNRSHIVGRKVLLGSS